jgi:hypothetical protein
MFFQDGIAYRYEKSLIGFGFETGSVFQFFLNFKKIQSEHIFHFEAIPLSPHISGPSDQSLHI